MSTNSKEPYMEKPIQVTFKNLDHSQAVETKVIEHVQKLEKYCDRIISCQVVIDCPHNNHNKGKHYLVHIDINVPGKELIIGRDPAKHSDFEDLDLAISQAFQAATRQVKEYNSKIKDKKSIEPLKAHV